jgi:hypothetical protein
LEDDRETKGIKSEGKSKEKLEEELEEELTRIRKRWYIQFIKNFNKCGRRDTLL